MQRNSFVQMSKLHNVRGRIYYISSDKKQENLYAVYETTDRKFWTELAKCNQEEFKKSGTEGKCIEARELIIALPESFVAYDPKWLLQHFTDSFKNQYGVDCISVLHHNKKKTNYHIHLIFAERTYLEHPIEKVATRNRYHDEQGNYVRTKKEVLDENGNLRKKCKVIKKGEIYERQIFTIKDTRFKQEHFLDEAKYFYTELINALVQDKEQKLSVFKRGDIYLATKKIGKNNPKADKIAQNNEIIQNWNHTVDQALVTGIDRKDILQLKKDHINVPIKESIDKYGNQPVFLFMIIYKAIELLEELIKLFIAKIKQVKENVEVPTKQTEKKLSESLSNTDVAATPTAPTITPPVKTSVPIATEKEVIPPRPKMSELAHKYEMQLEDIMDKLRRQNRALQDKKLEKALVDEELKKCTGIFKSKQRKELQKQSDDLGDSIKAMKQGLSHIVQDYKYPTVDAFLKEYRQGKSEYESFVKAKKDWESKYGENSLHRRLAEKQAEVKKRQEERESNYRPPMNRGAR